MLDTILKTAISSLVGTSVMTASSTLMSSSTNDFREPQQLQELTARLLPFLKSEKHELAGWTGHYLMGVAFSAIYVALWKRRKLKPSLANGLLLGGLSGIIGMGIWKATFKIHPLPQAKNYHIFYLQRIPAHVVFAIAATLAYRLVLEVQKKRSIDQLETQNNQKSAHADLPNATVAEELAASGVKSF